MVEREGDDAGCDAGAVAGAAWFNTADGAVGVTGHGAAVVGWDEASELATCTRLEIGPMLVEPLTAVVDPTVPSGCALVGCVGAEKIIGGTTGAVAELDAVPDGTNFHRCAL